MKRTNLILTVTFLLFVSSHITAKNYDYLYENLQFKMDKLELPQFKDQTRIITEYGAVGDGLTLNTTAFDRAFKEFSSQGGGTLIVPNGIWFTGPVVLQSNINLHLEKGAMILFTPDLGAYPLVKTSFEGLDTRRCQSPISGRNLTNIAITGEGTINGNGQAWRPLKRQKVTESHWKEVLASGGVLKRDDYWFPSEGSLKGEKLAESNLNVPVGELTEEGWLEIKDFLRPVMVSLINCKNVLLEGVLFENSPSWNIHPLMCENLIVDNVFIRNPSYAQNGDGIDIESCKNVVMVNSTLDVGDDAICLKSGKDEDGRKRGKPTENVIVDNCTVFKGHGGFVVGSEMSGGVRNVAVTNCKFIGTDVGLRFKSKRGRGGVVENIYISGITMLDIVTDSFLFDLFYGGKSASESLAEGDEGTENKDLMPVSVETPAFRNIYVENLVSRNARRAMFFNGLPEMNIHNIHIKNSFFTAEFGAKLSESTEVEFVNVHIVPEKGPAVELENVKHMSTENLSYPTALKNPIKIIGDNNINIKINK